VVTSGAGPVRHRDFIVKAEAEHKLPAIYYAKVFARRPMPSAKRSGARRGTSEERPRQWPATTRRQARTLRHHGADPHSA
jgi:hypothetical protein